MSKTAAEEVKELLEMQHKTIVEYKQIAETRVDKLEAAFNRINLGIGGGGGEPEPVRDATAERLRNYFSSFALPRNAAIEDRKTWNQAFNAYLLRGENPLSPELRNALQVGVDSDGGYWVDPDKSGRMVAKMFQSSPLRAVAAVQTTDSDALEGAIDKDEVDSGWVAEKEARNETDSPEMGVYRIPVHEQYAQPAVTQKMLDDAGEGRVGSFLENKILKRLSRQENTAFVLGDGVKKPRGFLTYTNVATGDATRTWGEIQYVPTGVAGGFVAPTATVSPADCLIDMTYKLKAEYRQGAAWGMNSNTAGILRKWKDVEGRFIWTDSLVQGQPPLLLGFPVVFLEDMPDIAANSLSVAFANWMEAYQIVDHRTGFRVQRDPFTAKPKVLFYATKRTGGAVINSEAIKLLKASAT